VETVIPLVHAPDDPGPQEGFDVDPVPETTLASSAGPWKRFMQIFR
jgi:hypothetical protein